MTRASTLYSQIHIGEIIRKQLKEEGRTLTWLADQVCCDSSNLTKLLSRNSIHTDILIRISTALKTDYFKCFSNHIQDALTDDAVRKKIIRDYNVYEETPYFCSSCE